MVKKYVAKTDIAISVYLKSGKNTHVPFSAKTGGGSVLYTDVVELQEALEVHPKYGKLFKLEQVIDPNKKPAKATKKAPVKPAAPVEPEEGAEDTEANEGEPVNTDADHDTEETTDEEDEGEEVKKIMVNSIDEAKDYLCEHFEGYSRTKLRSKVAIKAAAEKEGFEFVGIEL